MNISSYTSCSRDFAILLTALTLTIGLPEHLALSSPTEETRIAKLEVRIAYLEARILKLEQQLNGKTSENPQQNTGRRSMSVQGAWRSKDNWSRIKSGMSFDQVTQILGRPTQTDMISKNQGDWYYEGHLDETGINVSGKIYFASRRVLTVNAPIW